MPPSTRVPGLARQPVHALMQASAAYLRCLGSASARSSARCRSEADDKTMGCGFRDMANSWGASRACPASSGVLPS